MTAGLSLSELCRWTSGSGAGSGHAGLDAPALHCPLRTPTPEESRQVAQAGGHLWVSGQPGVPCGAVSAGGARRCGFPCLSSARRHCGRTHAEKSWPPRAAAADHPSPARPQPAPAPPLPPPAPSLCSPPPHLQLCAGALPQGRLREPQGVLRAQWGRTQASGQPPW